MRSPEIGVLLPLVRVYEGAGSRRAQQGRPGLYKWRIGPPRCVGEKAFLLARALRPLCFVGAALTLTSVGITLTSGDLRTRDDRGEDRVGAAVADDVPDSWSSPSSRSRRGSAPGWLRHPRRTFGLAIVFLVLPAPSACSSSQLLDPSPQSGGSDGRRRAV
jgi:hypothetical protein